MARESCSLARAGSKPTADLIPRDNPMGCILQEPRAHPRSHSPRSPSSDSSESVHLIPDSSRFDIYLDAVQPVSAARRRRIQERIDMYLGNVHLVPAHRRHRAQEIVVQRCASFVTGLPPNASIVKSLIASEITYDARPLGEPISPISGSCVWRIGTRWLMLNGS